MLDRRIVVVAVVVAVFVVGVSVFVGFVVVFVVFVVRVVVFVVVVGVYVAVVAFVVDVLSGGVIHDGNSSGIDSVAFTGRTRGGGRGRLILNHIE